jgi:vancomycin resistance protein YoaR
MAIKKKKVLNLIAHFCLGGFLGLGILFLFTVISLASVGQLYENTVYPGVYLFGEDVSGRTLKELGDFFDQKEKFLKERKVTFTRDNDPKNVWEITADKVDLSFDRPQTIQKVWALGRSSDLKKRFLETYLLLTSKIKLDPIFTYDDNKMTVLLGSIGKSVDIPVQEGLFEFQNGRVTSFQGSKEGLKFNQAQAKEQILAVFLNQNPQEQTGNVYSLPLETILPKSAQGKAEDFGIKELIGTGESYFQDSIPSRVHNITLAANNLHGILIAPGETFSFGQQVGDISLKTGYVQAYIIIEGKTILGDGGGVCQVSTTLFRAALNGGLPIVERQAHQYRVGFYEQGGYPPGLDATVFPPSPDFKFKNDTTAYVLIQTKIDNNLKKLTFEFYGTSDGRKVELAKPIVHSTTPPPPTVYIDDPTLPLGVEKRVDTAHWGAKVSVNWKVFKANGDLKEDRTFWSNYIPWAAVYNRGTKPL